MTQILNVDALKAPKERAIVINGKQHFMQEMTVEKFIELTDNANKLDSLENVSISDQVKFYVDTVLVAFPTCDREELMKLTVKQLHTLVDFARNGSLPEEATEEQSEGPNDNKKKEK